MKLSTEDISHLVWAIGDAGRERGDSWDALPAWRREAISGAVERVRSGEVVDDEGYHDAWVGEARAAIDRHGVTDTSPVRFEGTRGERAKAIDRMTFALIRTAAGLA